jgi:hypothetical protein
MRLSVLWGLLLIDRSGHLGFGSIPLIFVLGSIFFPEAFLLAPKTTPLALSEIVVVTSLLLTALWTLIRTLLDKKSGKVLSASD